MAEAKACNNAQTRRTQGRRTMTPRYIEYYEVSDPYSATPDTVEYYYMPLDDDAENKADMDFMAAHVWRLDTKRDTVVETHGQAGTPHKPLSRIQLLKIQLEAKPVPYCEFYLSRQKRLDKIARENK
jgi:hypothetical protein